jgi:hypothetical protein
VILTDIEQAVSAAVKQAAQDAVGRVIADHVRELEG